MKRSELFVLMLDKVSDLCEIRKESILSATKIQSVVDAKIQLIHTLRYFGMSNDDIALTSLKLKNGTVPTFAEIKSKAKNINRLYMMYDDRCSQSRLFKQMGMELMKTAYEIQSQWEG